MIKSKTTNVKISGRNLNSFKDKGYICKVGDILNVKISDLSINSKNIVEVECDLCGNVCQISYNGYNKNIKINDIYCCNKCKQSRIEETNLKKYGQKRPLQNKEICEKTKNTNLKKWGGHPCKSLLIKEKIKNKVNEFIENNKELHQEYIEKSISSRKDKTIEKYKKYNIENLDKGVYSINCDKGHNYKISSNLLFLRNKYKVECCTICNKINDGVSGLELKFRDFIENNCNGLEIIYNNRKIITPYELDIFIPKLKIAFEFNGNYWHSLKDKDYHHKKSRMCLQNKVRLFHIWESDWKNRTNFIKEWIINIINNKSFVHLNNEIINEFSVLTEEDFLIYRGYKVKRFFGDDFDGKLINIVEPVEIHKEIYNEGYKIYEII